MIMVGKRLHEIGPCRSCMGRPQTGKLGKQIAMGSRLVGCHLAICNDSEEVIDSVVANEVAGSLHIKRNYGVRCTGPTWNSIEAANRHTGAPRDCKQRAKRTTINFVSKATFTSGLRYRFGNRMGAPLSDKGRHAPETTEL